MTRDTRVRHENTTQDDEKQEHARLCESNHTLVPRWDSGGDLRMRVARLEASNDHLGDESVIRLTQSCVLLFFVILRCVFVSDSCVSRHLVLFSRGFYYGEYLEKSREKSSQM